MSEPKKPPPLGKDRFDEMRERLGRNLDDDLAVQGSDEEEREAGSADEDDDEIIPLSEETLNRGGGRR